MVPVAPAGEGLGESPGKAWGVLMRVSDGYMPSAGVAAQANTDDASHKFFGTCNALILGCSHLVFSQPGQSPCTRQIRYCLSWHACNCILLSDWSNGTC